MARGTKLSLPTGGNDVHHPPTRKPRRQLSVSRVEPAPRSAGKGSSGGNGGTGGSIEIIVDDSQTHLLMALDWDIRGGTGGRPGQHGHAGKAGLKGFGGKGHDW